MYAEDTKVPVERSQAEIEKLLKSRGATKFNRGDDGKFEIIACHLNDRLLMFELPAEPLFRHKALALCRNCHPYGAACD